MALSNKDRIGRALDLLEEGLFPFVKAQFEAAYGKDWEKKAQESIPELKRRAKTEKKWDVQILLSAIQNNWTQIFGETLGRTERSIVNELRDVRNEWAHQGAFVLDDTYRALDSMQRLLTAIAAPQAQEVEKHKKEILRLRYEEEAKRELKSATQVALEGSPQKGLKPWRMVMIPHEDVRRGTFQQAEFAADLWAVHNKSAAAEYGEPIQFFERTFPTQGLRQLLTNALRRLTGNGGDPVIELQTSFGGGKTHSMLALYHLLSGVDVTKLRDMEPVLKEAGVTKVPSVKRAVFVGTALSPVNIYKKPDGVEVRTMWGEIAWQLGQYKLVKDADEQGISPGREVLAQIFKNAAPCLVMIDEWVAYARLLNDENNLPGGSFESCLTFAQSLTEAASSLSNVLVVASIPSSEIEVGGSRGRRALESLKSTFKRVAASWRPATADEGFEIVRRRLFEPLSEEERPARDAVVLAFSDYYRKEAAEFPSHCKEGDYRRRLEASYPIHPELFDKLYNEWSTLDKFQRTRGVLRLMAAVIHTLWSREDSSLMIMPSMVPIDQPIVREELTNYFEQTWSAVIDKEIDGENSLPRRLDSQNPNFGRYAAARRVARALFLGSAPTISTAHRGIEDIYIKLGCAQPGEGVAVFGDALRRLTDNASYIYVDGKRYWVDTQPSVTRLAQDRAAQLKLEEVYEEIKRRLREQGRSRGEFAKVHVCPSSSADVPDERESRLVILSPEFSHKKNNGKEEGSAKFEANKILESRAAGPRTYKNTLVFLAADRDRLAELESAVRNYLAWKSIHEDHDTLNLDAFNEKQAASKRKEADETVDHRIPQTYCWLLTPGQSDAHSPIEWEEKRLPGEENFAAQAFKKLKNEGALMPEMAGTVLRHHLDKIPLWRGNHVTLRQLVEDFAQYLYLPRLKDPEVLASSVEDGLVRTTWSTDTFAYADRFDEATKRYVGLVAGSGARASITGDAVVVKPEVAIEQLKLEPAPRGAATTGETPGAVSSGGTAATPAVPAKPVEKKFRRFHGSVALNSARLARDAGTIADEVIQHISGLLGAKVEVTLEIQATIPDGAPEHVVRTVNENCRTLKFKESGFEED